MKTQDGEIVECTRDELHELWLKQGWDDLFSFTVFRQIIADGGVTVTEEGEKHE